MFRKQARPRPPSGRPRVLVVYQHLPHYRYGVFRELADDSALDVQFVAAEQSRDGSIATIPPELLGTVHIVRNRWIGRFLWQSGLLGLLLRHRPDATIFLGDASYASTWLGSVLCRLLGSSVLFWTMGWRRPDAGLLRMYRLAFYRLADQLLLYGETGRAIGARMGYPSDRMMIIYNSSSTPPAVSESQPAMLERLAALLPTGERPVVAAVARLNHRKRLDLLVAAAGLMRAEGMDIDVLLVGSGPVTESLRTQASALGVRLTVVGPVYGDEAMRLVYGVTDVTVVPSGAGLTVVQSLRFGRPVITHDDMADQGFECEAIRPGITGDLYRNGDLRDLVRLIGVWIERQRTEREATAAACVSSIQENWSAPAQARLIRAEVLRSVGDGDAV